MKEWKMKANITSFFWKSGSSTKKIEENISLSSTFFHFRLIYFFRKNSLFLFLPEENTLPNSPLVQLSFLSFLLQKNSEAQPKA
jgi:hypothetical protein